MDDVIKLIQAGPSTRDHNGNIKYTEQKVKRFCKVRSATRSEFYAAETESLKPELVITISSKIDYNGERELEYNGERYVVIRSYWSGDEVELTVGKKIGGGMLCSASS